MDALAVLQRLSGGQLIPDLAEALVLTADEVVNTGKPGTVTLTLKVSTKRAGDVVVVIDETIARRSPQRDPRGAYFYAVEGGLHSQDPRQTVMDLRVI